MKHHGPFSDAMVVPTVPPRIPVLHAEDLPGGDDWALLTTLRVDRDESFEHELQYDRYGSLMLAPAAFD
jgi:hypothetical protein